MTRMRVCENSTLRHSYLQEQSSESVHVDSLLVELDASNNKFRKEYP